MIFGAHVIVYSKDATADRLFFRDVLGLASVDAGQGWLIFALPPAEAAVHPAEEHDRHELYFMCDDLNAFIAEVKKHGIAFDPVEDQGYGILTKLTLLGGGNLGPAADRPPPGTRRPIDSAHPRPRTTHRG